MSKKVLIVGAGLAGATVARCLHNHGYQVVVAEERPVIGGNVRVETMNGVPYEVYGPHIFHTEDVEVADFVKRYVSPVKYEHRVMTHYGDRLISWPPQMEEVQSLPTWERIERDLRNRPPKSWRDRTNFQTYAIDVMGAELYWELCHYYTEKQWGVDPSKLDASFAPKRIDFRTDGDTRLFKDRFQWWMNGTKLVEGLLYDIPVITGQRVTVDHPLVHGSDIQVVTAPLDVFLEEDRSLRWRGQSFTHTYMDRISRVLPAPVVNEPRANFPEIREYETSQMAGHRGKGTVLSVETPGADERHYPVNDVEGVNRARQKELTQKLTGYLPHSYICGRLATYTYIDMDQAVRQALNTASRIRERHS